MFGQVGELIISPDLSSAVRHHRIQTMKMNAIDQFGMDTVDAILSLIEKDNSRYLQALVLLYSAIDTLAWASLTSGDVTRLGFCDWVDKYMQPKLKLGCTSSDIYGARCSILHSSAAESSLSRQGNVSELWYVTSPSSAAQIEAQIKKEGAHAKVVCFTSLVDAFTNGASRFSDDITEDQNKFALCTERMKRWLKFVPTNTLK